MGFSSQWNFGKKRHSWPAPLINVSSIDSWFIKSSCWERSRAMQQFWLSNGHTGAHFALKCVTLNPRSSRTACKPFSCPDAIVIFCGCPRKRGSGFDWGVWVSHCLCCFPPLDLFISKALSASGGKDAWAEDWSKMKRLGFWDQKCWVWAEASSADDLSPCVR